MLFKPFAAAGLVLAGLAGAASAQTIPGFPQVTISSPNARVVLLPGAFLPLTLDNGPPPEASSNEQNTAGSQPALLTPGSADGLDAPSALAKIAQISPPLLHQIADTSSSSSETDFGGGSGLGGLQPVVSTVPLPAGLPLFGAALIATAALGWGCKLRSVRT